MWCSRNFITLTSLTIAKAMCYTCCSHYQANSSWCQNHLTFYCFLKRVGSFSLQIHKLNLWPIIVLCCQLVTNFHNISIVKGVEHLVSFHLGRLIECCGVLPTTQFAYRNGLGTSDALLCMSHILQSALESGQEARIVQIDFSAAFDRVNHQGILYKLFSVGIGGSVLSILTQFQQTNHSTLWWMVVRVNWLILCQECCRIVFWANYCFSCALRSCFPFGKLADRLC